jgi:predicted  nucleic acid-binding Zn-ribbon protein
MLGRDYGKEKRRPVRNSSTMDELSVLDQQFQIEKDRKTSLEDKLSGDHYLEIIAWMSTLWRFRGLH